MTTITGRKQYLKQLLRSGNLSPDDITCLKDWFERYYTPDIGQAKYHTEDIDTFFIASSGRFNTLCLHIRLKDGTDTDVSSDRLAGERRSQYENRIRALRTAIEPQIELFRQTHPLCPTDICPIENIPLGVDAQVDHYNPPFHILVKEWLDEINVKPSAIYSAGVYRFEEPYQTQWIQYHKTYANLRWLSKEGNKKAHRLTQNKASGRA
jgi:hypothetical protein